MILQGYNMSWDKNFCETIWHILYADIQNEYGVAGLMGNLVAESGLIPYRKQGDFSNGYSESITYTYSVDSGEMLPVQFVLDEIGYGLAQWTFSARKQALYDFWESSGATSISDTSMQCAFLLDELKTSYPDVYKVLLITKDIRTASNKVLHDFERPADAKSKEKERYNYSVEVYKFMTGKNPDQPNKKKNFNFVLFNNRRRKIW